EGEHADLGLGQRLQQPREDSGQREVERTGDGEGRERSLVRHTAGHGTRRADEARLVRGVGERDDRCGMGGGPIRRFGPGRQPAHGEVAWMLVQRASAHGATTEVDSPRVSDSPSAMLADCTAAPAVPLVKLSIATTATTRPARSSTATWTCAVLAPRTAAVVGHCPSASRCTNGSSAYACSHASRAVAASPVSLAVTVARIPRLIGTRVGVNDRLTGAPAAAARFCSISGM